MSSNLVSIHMDSNTRDAESSLTMLDGSRASKVCMKYEPGACRKYHATSREKSGGRR